MVDSYLDRLPTSLELPCSDDTPVDNEDQNFLPNFLLFLLQSIWAKRLDWFFGVDMAIYHTTGVNPRVPVVPYGFLSLGVERRKKNGSRSSYVVWEENGIVPTFVLEVVSQIYGGEYDKKREVYAKLDVLYYIVYNPNFCQRDQHQPLEVYKLVDGFYQLQIGEPFWMQEVGLGIGRGINSDAGLESEVLYWYNQQSSRYQTAEELLSEYRQQFGELPGL